MMSYKILRIVCALLLLVTLNTGCATRYIEFNSDPSGATVKVDDLQCTTPCTMAVDGDSTQALLINGVQEIPVKLPPAKKTRNFSWQFFDKTEKTLLAIGTLFFAVGMISYSSIDDSINDDEEISSDMVLFTGSCFVAAGIFGLGMFGAKTVKERSQSEVRVTFVPEVLPTTLPTGMESIPPPRALPDKLGLSEEALKRLYPAQDSLVPHPP